MFQDLKELHMIKERDQWGLDERSNVLFIWSIKCRATKKNFCKLFKKISSTNLYFFNDISDSNLEGDFSLAKKTA